MGSLISGLLVETSSFLAVRADLAPPDLRGTFEELLDLAQTPYGMGVIAALLVGGWLVFRAFR